MFISHLCFPQMLVFFLLLLYVFRIDAGLVLHWFPFFSTRVCMCFLFCCSSACVVWDSGDCSPGDRHPQWLSQWGGTNAGARRVIQPLPHTRAHAHTHAHTLILWCAATGPSL